VYFFRQRSISTRLGRFVACVPWCIRVEDLGMPLLPPDGCPPVPCVLVGLGGGARMVEDDVCPDCRQQLSSLLHCSEVSAVPIARRKSHIKFMKNGKKMKRCRCVLNVWQTLAINFIKIFISIGFIIGLAKKRLQEYWLMMIFSERNYLIQKTNLDYANVFLLIQRMSWKPGA